MKTKSTALPDGGAQPCVRIELFRDPNGNFFASLEAMKAGGMSFGHTPTYTTAVEAIDAAAQRIAAWGGAGDAGGDGGKDGTT